MSPMHTGNWQLAHRCSKKTTKKSTTFATAPAAAHFTSKLWPISGSGTDGCDSADPLDQMDPAAGDDQVAKLIETQRLMTRVMDKAP